MRPECLAVIQVWSSRLEDWRFVRDGALQVMVCTKCLGGGQALVVLTDDAVHLETAILSMLTVESKMYRPPP